jgi:hypothetical protein
MFSVAAATNSRKLSELECLPRRNCVNALGDPPQDGFAVAILTPLCFRTAQGFPEKERKKSRLFLAILRRIEASRL